jgi:hypothetical protein
MTPVLSCGERVADLKMALVCLGMTHSSPCEGSQSTASKRAEAASANGAGPSRGPLPNPFKVCVSVRCPRLGDGGQGFTVLNVSIVRTLEAYQQSAHPPLQVLPNYRPKRSIRLDDYIPVSWEFQLCSYLSTKHPDLLKDVGNRLCLLLVSKLEGYITTISVDDVVEGTNNLEV